MESPQQDPYSRWQRGACHSIWWRVANCPKGGTVEQKLNPIASPFLRGRVGQEYLGADGRVRKQRILDSDISQNERKC